MPTVQELLEIKDRVEGDLLARPGVTGVDVGFKEVAGRLTDRLAIRIHVDVKSDLVPADQRVPAQIEGAETDVLERRYELHVAVRKAAAVAPREDTERHGSLVGGISMGPSREVDGLIFAGTLGATLVDGTGGGRAALTNFHVACVDSHFQLGDRMVQPSRIDGGSVPDDEFGSLLRQILGPQVDGAVIAIDADHPSEPGVLGLGAVQGLNTALQIGMGVHKRGRTTELTHGSVDGIGLTVTIDYGFDIGPRTLINQISIVPDTSRNPKFSDHGDSGSLVLDDGGLALGLLFAGSAASTLANPIDAVLSDLDLTLLLGGHGVLTELPDVLSVGAFATPDDGFQHVVVATADGAIHELYWRGGQPAGRGLLATLPGAVSVAGYVSSDGFRHTIVATSDGDVHELYWQDGAPGQGVLTNLPGVVSVGGYFGGDGFQHVIAATDDGNVHELYWQDGAPGQGVLTNLPGVFAVAGFAGSDGFQHVIAATDDGNVHELYWQDGAPGHGVLANLSGVVSVGGFVGADGVQHALAATSDGRLHDLSWQGSEAPRRQAVGVLPGVLAAAGYGGPDAFEHVIAADGGAVHEYYFRTA